jgi:glyceraldehyde-3-phosphate dehydrogenase (NAD(P))
MPNIVHIIGTGCIGEPLIGLLADNRKSLCIDEVTFHKRTPIAYEKAKVTDLLRRGAKLSVDDDKTDAFKAMGLVVSYSTMEAARRATVIVDCTPAGNDNKAKIYSTLDGPRGFIAQGSEHGFGIPYAHGINDEALLDAGKFLQVASCNTHNICAIVKTLGFDGRKRTLDDGRFVCMRRSSDVSQDEMSPGPTVGSHKDKRFGTHHARDAHAVFSKIGHDVPVWSSAIEMPTQYMHCLWFSMVLDREMPAEEALERFRQNPRVALTKRSSANQVFSFGRDHGYYGRIFNQTVVVEQSIASRGKEVIGFCFTPQDGNSLMSSVAAVMWYLEGDVDRLRVLQPYLFEEV